MFDLSEHIRTYLVSASVSINQLLFTAFNHFGSMLFEWFVFRVPIKFNFLLYFIFQNLHRKLSKMSNKTKRNYRTGKYFVVEDILKDKIENGKKSFLVKWKNYSDSRNEWVEEKDLSCPDLILEFESRERSQLKRKMEETAELGPSSKRRKNQEVIIVLFIHWHL